MKGRRVLVESGERAGEKCSLVKLEVGIIVWYS